MADIHKCGFCNEPYNLEWDTQVIAGTKRIIICCAGCGAVLGIVNE